MMTYTVRSLDDLRRHRMVWLGGKGWLWPFFATYQAWGLWVLFLAVDLFIRWVTPLNVPTIPVFDAAWCCLAATLVSGYLDHDKPVRMFLPAIGQHLRAPRAKAPTKVCRPAVRRVEVHRNEAVQ